MKRIKFFGLLYISDNGVDTINFKSNSLRQKIQVYLNNAKLLANSLSLQGIDFELLVNDIHFLENSIDLLSPNLSVRQIDFPTQIPRGIRFYSAHFKVDAFRYIAGLDLDYAALCDLDVVCINSMPISFQECINCSVPIVYDISDQVIPAYGLDVIHRDIGRISSVFNDGRWLGGEFLSGPPNFFEQLVKEIDAILPKYFSLINEMHHVGDEAYTSIAVAKLKFDGMNIIDGGTLGIIGRYWNTKINHQQKGFSYFGRCFLLHLPADKYFLSKYSSKNFVREKFLSDYCFEIRFNLRRIVRSLIQPLRLP